MVENQRENRAVEGYSDMKKRILLLLAHPDDETFGPGGTIAKAADKGGDFCLPAAPGGEGGMLGAPPVTDRAHLGEVRAAELTCAAGILGIRKVSFLGFIDGQLASTPRERIVEKAVEQIRWTRPHVLIGFGPEGVSRHPDHMVMCSVALEAFDAAADPSRFPHQLENGIVPWAPWKLYQFEIAQEVFDAWGVPLAGLPAARLTTIDDTSAYVDRKIEAISSPRTQAKDYNRILPRDRSREFSRRETFVLAKSRFSSVALPETDLFAGIPIEEP